MKRKRISGMSALLFFVFFFSMQASTPGDEVVRLDRQDNFYRTGNVYIGGQPNLETLHWLKEEGVMLVVNLRSEEEMEDFAGNSFNEGKVVSALGMQYVAIPMSGRNAYNPLTLAKVAEAICGHEGKLLIHCAGAGRATNVYMAYLVQYENIPVEKALEMGRQMAFYFPFGDLLGDQLQISLR